MWRVEFLDDRVRSEFLALPADIQARFERIAALVSAKGLLELREPYVKHLEGPLWEMRMKGRDGIARGIYVTRIQKRVVVLRFFRKKTEKAPRSEIEIAYRRERESR
jgi:phage-related protein